jgi:hypothetical protein
MQALTIAIGPAGIDYFAQRLVSQDLTQMLAKLAPPNNDMTIPNFSAYGFGWSASYSNIKINLREGKLNNFSPVYKSIAQEPAGKFPMVMTASNFSASYKWAESYYEYFCSSGGRFPSCHGGNRSGNYNYNPGIGLLTTDVILGFEFNASTKTYDIKVIRTSGKSTNVSPNIPGNSVIQNQDQGCFTSKVSDATAQSVSAINFEGAIASLIPPLLRSIPGSGRLTPDIFYDFGLGDSGLEFPADNKGIKIGVTGAVRYRDEQYPGTPPSPLPVPPPPLDANHMRVYVSDYEINALHWAYFKSGLLVTRVTPSELPDPNVLKVKTYVTMIPSFKPFTAFAMDALVEPLQAPVAVFQQVYQFTTEAMTSLHQKLPSDVYQQILGLEGNGYASQADLETALSEAQVPTQWYEAIRNATKGMGMVVTQNIKFTLTIQNGAPAQPNLIFSVARTDILDNLGLGITNQAQTMKYKFRAVKSEATFVSSTVPGFVSRNFGDIIWPISGEPRYTETLQKVGETGVPIPIMSGFQFLFQQAQLSIQEGFVSILAQVTFKTSAHDQHTGRAGSRA